MVLWLWSSCRCTPTTLPWSWPTCWRTCPATRLTSAAGPRRAAWCSMRPNALSCRSGASRTWRSSGVFDARARVSRAARWRRLRGTSVSRSAQGHGMAAKVLRRSGDIVSGGGALGTRLVQHNIYCMSLALCWICGSARPTARRCSACAPRLGWPTRRSASTALCRWASLRTPTTFRRRPLQPVFVRRLRRKPRSRRSLRGMTSALLDHPLRLLVSASIMKGTQRLREVHLGGRLVEATLSRPHVQAELTTLFRLRLPLAEIAAAALRRRAARWAEGECVDQVAGSVTLFYRRRDVPDALSTASSSRS